MAYKPASCDNKCKGCEMNKSGWCIWKDRKAIEDNNTSYIKEDRKWTRNIITLEEVRKTQKE